MFQGIRDDFDPAYWTRSSVAVLLATSAAAAGGTAWLVYALLSRILHFLVQWLLALLFPPSLAVLLVPNPVEQALYVAVETRAIREGLDAVELDLGDDELVELDEPEWAPEPPPILELEPEPEPEPEDWLEPPPPPDEVAWLEEVPEEVPEEVVYDLMSVTLKSEIRTADVIEAGVIEADVREDRVIGLVGILGTTGRGEVMDSVFSDESELGTLLGTGTTVDLWDEGPGGVEGGVVGGVQGGVVGGVEGGVVGGQLSGVMAGSSRAWSAPRAVRIVKTAEPRLSGAQKKLVEDLDGAHCTARVWVDAEGKVTRTAVQSGCPAELRDAVSDAVSRSRFEPATREGEPISGETRMVFAFVP
ncbi:MAG: energy transducer TonB [Myxococcota bacterium]